MPKGDGFYSSHDDHYLVCDYCGSDMLVKESENDKSVLYVKCTFCAKSMDRFWDLQCELRDIAAEIVTAVNKSEPEDKK